MKYSKSGASKNKKMTTKKPTASIKKAGPHRVAKGKGHIASKDLLAHAMSIM